MIECIVCLNSVTDPVCIPCGHIFCTCCLDNYIAHIPRHLVGCPVCRDTFPRPDVASPRRTSRYVEPSNSNPSIRKLFLNYNESELQRANVHLRSELSQTTERKSELERQLEVLQRENQDLLDDFERARKTQDEQEEEIRILTTKLEVATTAVQKMEEARQPTLDYLVRTGNELAMAQYTIAKHNTGLTKKIAEAKYGVARPFCDLLELVVADLARLEAHLVLAQSNSDCDARDAAANVKSVWKNISLSLNKLMNAVVLSMGPANAASVDLTNRRLARRETLLENTMGPIGGSPVLVSRNAVQSSDPEIIRTVKVIRIALTGNDNELKFYGQIPSVIPRSLGFFVDGVVHFAASSFQTVPGDLPSMVGKTAIIFFFLLAVGHLAVAFCCGVWSTISMMNEHLLPTMMKEVETRVYAPLATITTIDGTSTIFTP